MSTTGAARGGAPVSGGAAAASAEGHAAGRLTKNQRQHRITKLLESQAVTSQTQLVALLGEQGIEATQTTVSRDLEDLGAVKVRLPGGDTAYALPELPVQQIAPEDHLRRVLGEWVVEVAHSSNLVVLRTPPGSAHVVGSALDRSGLEGVVGTVAGDDTVLVVVDEQVGGKAMAAHLQDVAGITAAKRVTTNGKDSE
jgi:transcriptional regulator of arginine metabolism